VLCVEYVKMFAGLFRRFAESEKANVAVIFGLALVPTIFLTGMGVDYTLAVDRETELNSAADAAALSAVTPTMMAGSLTASQTQAVNTFNAQASQIANTNYSPSNVTVTVTASGSVRTATVTWAAKSVNTFPNVLGMTTIAIGGSSQATAGLAPNINFYLLLDSSPSMAIPATSAGITTLVNNTSSQGGCAFACHESNPSADGLGNPGGEDNYTLARNLGLTLRIDNLRTAAANLATTAKTTETNSTASYQMAIYTFDVGVTTIAAMTSNLSTVSSDASNINLLEVYDNNNVTQGNGNNDTDTNWDTAMSTINTTMPNPGSGTTTKGDTPQEVLFIVTDGVVDETVGSTPSLNSAYGSYEGGNRQQSTINPLNSSGSEVDKDWCTTIKNRGIRIAVLYTEYLPLAEGSWYLSYVAPIQSNIGTQLQACASPGLYYEVTTDGDISAALADLFDLAVQSAYLSK
jgi:Flp pilus assembly protein TadG